MQKQGLFVLVLAGFGAGVLAEACAQHDPAADATRETKKVVQRALPQRFPSRVITPRALCGHTTLEVDGYGPAAGEEVQDQRHPDAMSLTMSAKYLGLPL
jgi:hypothetical protein